MQPYRSSIFKESRLLRMAVCVKQEGATVLLPACKRKQNTKFSPNSSIFLIEGLYCGCGSRSKQVLQVCENGILSSYRKLSVYLQISFHLISPFSLSPKSILQTPLKLSEWQHTLPINTSCPNLPVF